MSIKEEKTLKRNKKNLNYLCEETERTGTLSDKYSLDNWGKEKIGATNYKSSCTENRGTVQQQEILRILPNTHPSSCTDNGKTVQQQDTLQVLQNTHPSFYTDNGKTVQQQDTLQVLPNAESYEVNVQRADIGATGTVGVLPEGYPSVVEKYTSCRWRLGYLMVAAFILVQSMLNSMSFALVCMTTAPSGTRNRTLSDGNQSAISQNTMERYADVNTTFSYQSSDAEFDYNSETQGLLISSVYYAGVISPLFGSFASRAFGPKKVILAGMFGGGLMMTLMPTAARTHVYLVVLCRVVLGFGVNIIASVSLDFWLYWAPEIEKAQLVAYSYTGYNIANILTFAVSGLLCLIPVDNGWPFIFYLFGGLTLLWCCVYQWMVYTRPEFHPTISEKEKIFILLKRSKLDRNAKQKAIPWGSIFRTRGIWAFFLTGLFHNFNTALLFSYIPSYMATALKFPVEENGFLSSLPYITRVISNLLISYLSLRLLNVFSVTHTRKIIQCTGFLMAAVVTSLLCVLKEGQSYEAVAVLSSDTPFQAVSVNAAFITPLDMAPQYAAIISSVGNVFGQSGNMIAPLVASFILTERTRGQWNTVFFMMSGVYVLSAFLFLLLGSGELQSWAYDVEMKIEKRKSKKLGHENESYIADQNETTHM